MVDQHIVGKYIGDWCFDIIINRGIKIKDGKRYKNIKDDRTYPEYFPVFMHTNVVYVFCYCANEKNELSQQTWQKQFKRDLKKEFPGYPVSSSGR